MAGIDTGTNTETSSEHSSHCTRPYTSIKNKPIEYNEVYKPRRQQYCYHPKKYEKLKAAKRGGQTL